jgi:MerR family transcriptional regulator, copper efflux regulator
MGQWTVGKLAKQASVNLKTIRYYEREGLLPEPPRTESGYRIYSSDAIRRVRFIKRAQELGFSLREINEILALRVDSKATASKVRERTEAKIADVERKIGSLQAIRKALVRLTSACNGRGPASECSILKAIESGETI